MTTKMKYLLPAVFMMAVGLMAADSKPAAPALVVQLVQTDDTDAYLNMLVKLNARIKAVTGIEQLRHTWEGDFAGEDSHGLFVVSGFESAAAASVLQEKMKDDPENKQLQAQLKSMRKLGPSYLYKAIRSDGIYAGGAVYNTSINTADEDGYVKALDALKAIFDANGFKDAKINLYRIVAGRTTATHLVVIALPSSGRVGELLDAITDKPMMKDWQIAAAKIRTVLHNGTYHEITK